MPISKKWNFALPDPENEIDQECFRAMSDILYTYLYSLSKHNDRRDYKGEFIEKYNYLYIDKSKDGKYKRLNVSEVCRILKISRTQYYDKLKILKKYHLIIEGQDEDGRKYYKFPFINSRAVLPVNTCVFFSKGGLRKEKVEDIIKLMAILKIIYFSDKKYFTMRRLRILMGFSPTNTNKDPWLQNLLAILRGFDIVNWTVEKVDKSNGVKEYRYYICFFNDEYNQLMEDFDENLKFSDINPLTEEELQELIPIK